MKIYLTLSVIFGVIVIAIIMMLPGKESDNASEKGLPWFKKESGVFAITATDLKEVLSHLSIKDTGSINQAKEALKNAGCNTNALHFFWNIFFLKKLLFVMDRLYRKLKIQEESSGNHWVYR